MEKPNIEKPYTREEMNEDLKNAGFKVYAGTPARLDYNTLMAKYVNLCERYAELAHTHIELLGKKAGSSGTI